jgi:hypothetical protein
MTLGAAHRHSHECGGNGLDRRHGNILIFIAACECGARQESQRELVLSGPFDFAALPSRSDRCVLSGAVPQDLCPHKFVVGYVGIQARDHPVPP